MAWTTPMTAVANAAFTAAQFNTYVRDNLNETAPAKATTAGSIFVATGANSIAERIVGTATVSASETTTLTSYTDLATPGPAITTTTGVTALVFVEAQLSNTTVASTAFADFEVTGATARAAADGTAIMNLSSTANSFIRASAVTTPTLTGGSNTFTMSIGPARTRPRSSVERSSCSPSTFSGTTLGRFRCLGVAHRGPLSGSTISPVGRYDFSGLKGGDVMPESEVTLGEVARSLVALEGRINGKFTDVNRRLDNLQFVTRDVFDLSTQQQAERIKDLEDTNRWMARALVSSFHSDSGGCGCCVSGDEMSRPPKFVWVSIVVAVVGALLLSLAVWQVVAIRSAEERRDCARAIASRDDARAMWLSGGDESDAG